MNICGLPKLIIRKITKYLDSQSASYFRCSKELRRKIEESCINYYGCGNFSALMAWKFKDKIKPNIFLHCAPKLFFNCNNMKIFNTISKLIFYFYCDSEEVFAKLIMEHSSRDLYKRDCFFNLYLGINLNFKSLSEKKIFLKTINEIRAKENGLHYAFVQVDVLYIYSDLAHNDGLLTKLILMDILKRLKNFPKFYCPIKNSKVYDLLIKIYLENSFRGSELVFFNLIMLPFCTPFYVKYYSQLYGIRKSIVDKMIKAGLYKNFREFKLIKGDKLLSSKLTE